MPITLNDLGVVLFLVGMEGLLSCDNALVLAMVVRGLPENQRKKALTYGIAGAFGFRFLSLFFLNLLMKSMWIKLVGGAYLLYIAIKNLAFGESDEEVNKHPVSFISAIITVELMDIAFSVDSILASVAVSSNFYVVLSGGILGIIMMRFAASLFIKLLDRFPRLEVTAYRLVFLIGAKLVLETLHLKHVEFSGAHSANMIFWGSMLVTVLAGFLPERQRSKVS